MIYFCIADGMADFLPNTQDYFACESVAEMREILDGAISEFTESECETPYLHMLSRHHWAMISDRGASSVNWRLCVARTHDRVLDIIGMTQDEYEGQSNV